MTVLEQGKFIKIFVRVKSEKTGNLVRVAHSNKIGYSKGDIEKIIPHIEETYLSNWEKYLYDIKENDFPSSGYDDWPHYLYKLNSVDEKDCKRYNLPTDYIILKDFDTTKKSK